jgi:hypothetical protein
MNRWQAAADLLGHSLKSHTVRLPGGRLQHWTTCSCGYESNKGNSARFAISAGIGHAKRVADALRAAGQLQLPDTPESLLKNVRAKR